MAHGTNILHSIKLPNGTTYEIHDAQAVHTLADLAALGMNTDGLFSYRGTVATKADLPTTGNKVGYVYHVTADHSEYVWATVDGGTSETWEEFGEHFVVNHTHDVTVTGGNSTSSVSGSAVVTGTNAASTVSGSATVTGTNASSNVSASGKITIPTIDATAKYSKVSTNTATFVKSYPGTTSKLVTTSVTSAGAAKDVIATVTPTTGSITGVSGSTTASKATAGTAVTVAKAGTAVTGIAKRASTQTTVGNADVGDPVTVATGLTGGKVTAGTKGSAASWSASVTDGVLSFSFTANTPSTPTSVTLPTASTKEITPAAESTTKIYGCGDTTSITPAVSNGSITPYTFADVTVPVAATATTVVTDVDTTTASVAGAGSAVTVATGALASTGGGSTVMTGLGTASTGSALTSATLAAGTSTDGIHTGDDVTIGSEEVTVSVSGTAAAQTWTQKSGTISGTAAAQAWTQKTGTISGTAAAQTWTQNTGSTGNPKA